MIAAPATRTLGAPPIASVGVVVTSLSVAGAFGVARLIFQDWHLARLLNFTPQGFVDGATRDPRRS